MKTTFSNEQLIHVWAQQSQAYGKSSGMRFEGPTLYSYQTPIANFVKAKRGGRVACLITSEKYSITTTTKHMPHAGDIPNNGYEGTQVFVVSHVGVEGGQSPRADNWHKHNLADLAERYAAAIAKVGRSSRYWELHHSDAHSIACTARYYCEHFGLKFSEAKFAPLTDAQLDAARAKYAAWEVRNETKVAREQEQARQRAEANRAAYEEKAAQWLAGDPVQVPHMWEAPTLLRVVGDRIETTRGAQFPVLHGLRAYDAIRMVRARGTEYRTPPETKLALGHYQIDVIHANGDVKAGCHFVSFKDIERVAKELGAA